MRKKKQTNKDKRLADFEERKRTDPPGVLLSKNQKWEYILIHPTSDDTELLETLDLKPTDCTQVDCYWNVHNDVVFLQVYADRYAQEFNKKYGIYAEWSLLGVPMLYISTYTRKGLISRQFIEELMELCTSAENDGLLFTDHLVTKKSTAFIAPL